MGSTTPPIPDSKHITDPAARQVIDQLAVIIADLRTRFEKLEADNAKLRADNEELRADNEELKRALFGQKSERMATIDEELRKKRKNSDRDKAKRRRQAKAKRRKNADDRRRGVRVEEHIHKMPDGELVCPVCGGARFRDLGKGEESYEWEWIPGHFVLHIHVREKKTCNCGRCVLTAPGPDRVSDGVQYGPGFHAHVVVSKCCDSIPLYRQAKQLKRLGIPISRSTLCGLFHRTAELVKPIWERMVDLLPPSEYVNADETSIRVQERGKTRRAYIWTFIAEKMVVYKYSPDRSGETPKKILGDSDGTLQVDAYSGYNHVTTPERRTRAGCLAHCRRYFYAALQTAPEESRHALDTILDLYEVEYDAAEQDILGTDKHLAMRRVRSSRIMKKWHQWLEKQKPLHPPKSPIIKGIKYTLNNWESLTIFLKDVNVRLDNNISEQQLRIIALGRKNYLFVGHDVAGENLAILQSLISTCEFNGVNPQEYLADVLIRTQTHPNSQLDQLLPWNWKPPDREEAGPNLSRDKHRPKSRSSGSTQPTIT